MTLRFRDPWLPVALLLIYWEYTYFNGHEIEQTIPSFAVFLSLGVLLVLEALFRYEKGVSQRKLLPRDLASTGINVLYTSTIGSSRSRRRTTSTRSVPMPAIISPRPPDRSGHACHGLPGAGR